MAHAPFEIFVPRRHNKGMNKKLQVLILGFHWWISHSLRVRNPPSAGCCAHRLCRIFPWTSASSQHPCVPTGGVIVALLTLACTVSPAVHVKPLTREREIPCKQFFHQGAPESTLCLLIRKYARGEEEEEGAKKNTSRRIPPGFA